MGHDVPCNISQGYFRACMMRIQALAFLLYCLLTCDYSFHGLLRTRSLWRRDPRTAVSTSRLMQHMRRSTLRSATTGTADGPCTSAASARFFSSQMDRTTKCVFDTCDCVLERATRERVRERERERQGERELYFRLLAYSQTSFFLDVVQYAAFSRRLALRM